jgi:hypothetical protein
MSTRGETIMNLNELPGAEIILPGLRELHNGESNTIGALLVAIAATRLTEVGFDIPKNHLAAEPEQPCMPIFKRNGMMLILTIMLC